jgi:hypothetical protein
VVAFHFLVGVVAGSIFAVRTLLTLIGLVLIGCIGVTIWRGISEGALWSVGSLVSIQAGYLSGIYVRSLLEQVGIVSHAPSRRHS